MGQAGASVVLAVLLGIGAWQGDEAAGSWRQSTRAETRESAALVETARFVLVDEAPTAFGIATLETQAAALRARADGPTAQLALDAAALDRTADQLLMEWEAAQPDSLVSERYELPGGGYNVRQRLVDLHRDPEGPPASASFADGDEAQQRGNRAADAMVPVVGAYLVALLASAPVQRRRWARTRRAGGRRPTPLDQPDPPSDIGLIPDPVAARSRHRRQATLGLVAWVLFTLLPVPALTSALAEERSDAQAARLATRLSMQTQVDQLISGLTNTLEQQQANAELVGWSRQYNALTFDQPEILAAEQARGTAEVEAAGRMATIAAAMQPVGLSGSTDASLIVVFDPDPDEWEQTQRRQASAVDTAEEAGSRATWLGLAIVLAGVALFFATLAQTTRTPARGTSWLAGLFVVLSFAVTIPAMLR